MHRMKPYLVIKRLPNDNYGHHVLLSDMFLLDAVSSPPQKHSRSQREPLGRSKTANKAVVHNTSLRVLSPFRKRPPPARAGHHHLAKLERPHSIEVAPQVENRSEEQEPIGTLPMPENIRDLALQNPYTPSNSTALPYDEFPEYLKRGDN